MTSEDKTAAAEWPLIYTGDDGTLTVTRMQMRTGQHNSAGTRAAAPPNYDLAMCDGFWASFTARATGEVYERSIADADVAELLPSSAANLSAELVAEIMSDGQPNTSVTLEAVYAVWPFQLTKRRAAAIELRMPRAASGASATGALEAKLRACTGRVAELETQVGSLKTQMSRVLDVLIARVLDCRNVQPQMIESLGLAGGKVQNQITNTTVVVWETLPTIYHTDLADVVKLRAMFQAGLDPNLRNTRPPVNGHEQKGADNTQVIRNETLLHHFISALDGSCCQVGMKNHGNAIVKIINNLIAHGADPNSIDSLGHTPLDWLDRANQRLIMHDRALGPVDSPNWHDTWNDRKDAARQAECAINDIRKILTNK